MAVSTWLEIETEDAQGYEETLKFRIAPAAFAVDTDLPTAAKINAVIDSIFGDAKISTNTVKSYSVRVMEDTPTGHTGGSGIVGTSQAARVSNALNSADAFKFRIPGLNKSNVVFANDNPNSVVTVGGLWDAVRAALVDAAIAVRSPETGNALAEDEIASAAVAFDGRRAPMKPR
jgi:hypothetical protein